MAEASRLQYFGQLGLISTWDLVSAPEMLTAPEERFVTLRSIIVSIATF